MKEVRLALIGFGNVAQGLTQIIHERGELFERTRGIKFIITAIADPIKGGALAAEGLPTSLLLQAANHPEGLRTIPGNHPDWDAMEMIQSSPSDVVVEMSYTNLETGEPATTYITEALRRRKHVVTTNKGPIALHYDELIHLARIHGVEIGMEGTVMSGTPVLRIGREIIPEAGINRIQGILNGTTNYILTQMESGCSYAEALSEAQKLGYAEADPTGDVEGYDAAAKVAILARLVMGVNITFSSVRRSGISGLSRADIESAQAEGMRWKLVGSLEREGDTVNASVGLRKLQGDHPLARITGATNALVYSTDLLGDLTVVGPGAGRLQTGYAVLQDLFDIYQLKSE